MLKMVRSAAFGVLVFLGSAAGGYVAVHQAANVTGQPVLSRGGVIHPIVGSWS